MVDHLAKYLIVTVFFLAGCNAGINDSNLSYISVKDAQIMLRDGQSNLLGVEKKTLLIDSRKKVDFNKNHIDGSINIPFGHLFAYEYKLNNVETIIVCGKSDNDPVAIAMSKELIKQGFKDVKTLRGGVDGWQDDYGSIESGD